MKVNPATILVVEHEPALRRLARSVLEGRLGYRLILAERAEDVIERFELGQVIDLVISDYHLPGMDGLALHHLLQRHGYRGRFVLTSGDPPETVPIPGGVAFLPRPWTIDEITHAIWAALEQR
jgi:CheY-like chemotaxis protein